jgi:hypothetical protein
MKRFQKIIPPKSFQSYKVPEHEKSSLDYFKTHSAENWFFRDYYDASTNRAKAINEYKSCLETMLNSKFTPNNLKAFIQDLKVRNH